MWPSLKKKKKKKKKEGKKEREADPEMSQEFKWSDKDFKTVQMCSMGKGKYAHNE